MLHERDLEQIEQKGIARETILGQLENFRKGFPPAHLVAPATPGNGIIQLDEKESARLVELYDKKSGEFTTLKFVPASGAATRMFKHLYEFMAMPEEEHKKPLEELSDKSFNSVHTFFKNLSRFAFLEELSEVMSRDGISLEDCLKNYDHKVILEYVLTEKGLNYGNLPKGLLKFHQYPRFSRTSLGEHLVEGAHFCRDREGNVHIHFTVSPEHRSGFQSLVEEVVPYYSEKFGVTYHVSFSEQKPSTDTIAVDMDNHPLRDHDGRMIFRPGGHGALIENLNDLDAHIVFIKNIDNIVPDHFKKDTYTYKKALGGYLLIVVEKIQQLLPALNDPDCDESVITEAEHFIRDEIELKIDERFSSWDKEEKRNYLLQWLNRPVRVCGMVKNEGEPGGGPFWVKNSRGEVSLQIVETSQIDTSNQEQLNMLKSATHFNPVDLVCSIRDHEGNKFDLHQYIDPETGFISIKSKDGKQLKAQELPGLWNGAMADWITIFVEVPVSTFNPVKTVNDLLRPQHQPPAS